MRREASAVKIGEQPPVVDVALERERLRPDSVPRLPQVQFDDPRCVHLDGVEQCDLRIAAAAVDPVGVEAEHHVPRIGRSEHVVELPRPAPQFAVVVVVGERHAQLAKAFAQAVERFGLVSELPVGLVFGTTPADGRRIGDDDPHAQRTGSLGDCDRLVDAAL